MSTFAVVVCVMADAVAGRGERSRFQGSQRRRRRGIESTERASSRLAMAARRVALGFGGDATSGVLVFSGAIARAGLEAVGSRGAGEWWLSYRRSSSSRCLLWSLVRSGIDGRWSQQPATLAGSSRCSAGVLLCTPAQRGGRWMMEGRGVVDGP